MAVISLGIGMVLGALLFGGKGKQDEPPTARTAAATTPTPCPEPNRATAAATPAVAVTPTTPAVAGATPASAPTAAVEPPAPAPAEGTEPDEKEPADPAAPTAAAGPNLGAGACALRVESTPTGATVAIAGQALGRTPLTIQGASCDAPVDIVLEKDRFERWEKRVTATATPLKLRAALRRPRVKLEIATTPKGATVTIGGRAVGKTPLTTEVSAWIPTKLSFSLTGYKPAQESVTPRPGRPARVSTTLVKEPPKAPPRPFRGRTPR